MTKADDKAAAEKAAKAGLGGAGDKTHCGLVMPISAIDGCSEQHWGEVKAILVDALECAGFTATLVSDADDVGIIQKRIIQNLYDNPIVVCDVSGKNPNVMFEMGMRLAFDKPTIIVKDDKTPYSFDTSPIEHLEYPRDLRFGKIVDFKLSLAEKVKATYQRSKSDANYTTFLKHFGKFSVAKLETTEVSKDVFIIEELREMRRLLSATRRDIVDRETLSESSKRRRAKDLIRSTVIDVLEMKKVEAPHASIREMEPELMKEVLMRLGPEAPRLFTSEVEFEDAVRDVVRSIFHT